MKQEFIVYVDAMAETVAGIEGYIPDSYKTAFWRQPAPGDPPIGVPHIYGGISGPRQFVLPFAGKLVKMTFETFTPEELT